MNPTGESPARPEHLAAVEQVLKAMTKLVNGRRIYAENNPRLEQFQNEFETTLHKFFDLEDDLVLTIEQYAIRWNDHIVYENAKREESLAFILFKDGIGEVTIGAAAVGRETNALVEIFADEIHSGANEEDVVTRFWNADFQHITHRVLDDYLSGEFGNGSSENAANEQQDETSDHPELLPSLNDSGRVFVDRATSMRSIDAFLRTSLMEHHPDGDDREREALYQRMLRTTFAVSAEETAIYTRELEEERARDGVAAFADTMLVFTLIPDNPSAVRDVTSILDRVVEFAVEEKNPATLASLVTLVRQFSGRADITEAARDFCARSEKRLAADALLASMLERATTPGPATTAVLAYARAVGAPTVEPLTRALHRAEGQALHRQICDTLIATAGDALSDALDRFDIDDPQVAVDAVYIARSLELPAFTPRLRELVFYPDARVKLEMIEWLTRRPDAESTQLLVQSLGDLDKRVRLRVLEALADRKEAPVRESIGAMAFAKDLGERPPDEQEAIFKTLGGVGDVHTVDQIRSLIEKRKLMHVGKGPESKLLAIRALERINDGSALDVLARLAEDPNEAVRLRAVRARETLGAALEEAQAEPKS